MVERTPREIVSDGPAEKRIWRALESVKDPEIPVVSVVEMGIVRRVQVQGERATVHMTPTFSGCPALNVMKRDIEKCVQEMGYSDVEVKIVYHPPWTTDWITHEAREKLKNFGLAPPARHGGRLEVTFYEPATCPHCDSSDTTVKNTFGPTLCRAIYYCNNCQQPFEQFKAL